MTTFKCSTCDKDVTTTLNQLDYRIVLKSEAMTTVEGATWMSYIPPPISPEQCFCSVTCLKRFVDKLVEPPNMMREMNRLLVERGDHSLHSAVEVLTQKEPEKRG